tara:strand:- start:532 stop:1014 length:483 start_codon:yes stop_codon:yes gene_type:complete
MSRITKNKKRINPRYFLNENEEWEAKFGDRMEPRIATGRVEIPGVLAGKEQGKSIIVDRGRQRSDGAYQIHVIDKGIGMYDSFYDAVMSGRSGEAYYMTDEQLEAGTMPDSVRPGQFSQSNQNEPGYGYPVDGAGRYAMRESNTIKTLMEGFEKYSKGEK